MDIKVIEFFPKEESKLNEIEMYKARWFLNVLRKKYSNELLERTFNQLEEDLQNNKK